MIKFGFYPKLNLVLKYPLAKEPVFIAAIKHCVEPLIREFDTVFYLEFGGFGACRQIIIQITQIVCSKTSRILK